ncbi:MAG TPA: hypothetical protein DHU96_23315 [Actinobacteria bacterium]|nr:hypothetical protein [Actinomycetota bacterium]
MQRLEAAKAKALADVEHARSELAHAEEGIGKPFAQATQLAAARERSARISKQLAAKAAEAAPGDGEPRATSLARSQLPPPPPAVDRPRPARNGTNLR